jgi:aspartate racemase
MKTIGIIGGITWLSSADYYRLLNQMVNERLGGVHAASIVLISLNFNDIKTLTEAGDWDGIALKMCETARKLEQAGAHCIMIGANTMHKIAATVQAAVNIPIIHIAEVTAAAIAAQNLQTVALLGTKYTMQMDFYKNKLKDSGISTIIPGEKDIELLNTAIYNELGKGIFLPETKALFVRVINGLAASGAQGAVLGCTEIPILIKQEDCAIPVFDTTALHAKAAVEFALKGYAG